MNDLRTLARESVEMMLDPTSDPACVNDLGAFFAALDLKRSPVADTQYRSEVDEVILSLPPVGGLAPALYDVMDRFFTRFVARTPEVA